MIYQHTYETITANQGNEHTVSLKSLNNLPSHAQAVTHLLSVTIDYFVYPRILNKCLSLCVCVYIYIYMCVCVCVCTYMHIYMYNIYIHVPVFSSMCVRAQLLSHVKLFLQLHAL